MSTILMALLPSVAIVIAALFFKIQHWRNYCRDTNRRQPLKLWYTYLEIEGVSSKEKQAFMRASNHISITGTLIPLITASITLLLMLP